MEIEWFAINFDFFYQSEIYRGWMQKIRGTNSRSARF